MKSVSFPITDPELLLQCIPQRAPMVFVDTLVRFSETQLTSQFAVRAPYLFVEKEYLTEAGLIEHMAQSVALHTGFHYFLRNEKAPVGYIGSINSVEIVSLPQVSDQMITEIAIIQEFLGVTLVDIQTKVGDQLIAKAQMKTVIAP